MSPRAKRNAFIDNLLARPFPKEWEAWLAGNFTLYRMLSDAERARLENVARVLIAEKSWEGCDGLKVTDIMKLTVAAQAALLLLGLEHDYFSRVQSIVLFPTAFELPAESWQERGNVISGQAVDYGTVYLSWDTVLVEAREPAAGHNLVIHEFAHQLDFLDGYTNGVPPMRSLEQTRRWQQVMQGTFNRLRRDLQKGRKTFLGSYAATNRTEFFSVASEKFFTLPAQLQQCHPELFDVLAEYYQVEPLRWFPAAKPNSDSAASSPSAAKDAVCDKPQAKVPPVIAESDFIDFNCPYCQTLISFPKADRGSLKQCPNCLESMIVPESAGHPAERLPFPIRTDRLVLRRLQTLDAKDVADLMSDAETLRYLKWSPMTLEAAEEWIAGQSSIRFPQPSDYCYFAIEAIEAGRVMGLAMFWFAHDEFNLAQFEIVIHPRWQRKGYGTEAVRGLLAYAFKGLRVRRIIGECDARNLPARRLLLRAGLRQESECIEDRFVKGEWVTTLGFALLKHEFEGDKGRGARGERQLSNEGQIAE